MGRGFVLALLTGAAMAVVACGGGAGAPVATEPAPVAPEVAALPVETVAGSDEPSVGLSIRELLPLLSRYGVGPQETGIDLMYAPPQFFELTGFERPLEAGARPTLVFILQETIHEGDLEVALPSVFLQVGDAAQSAPYLTRVTAEDPHHRTSVLLFLEPSAMRDGLLHGVELVRLMVPMADGTVSVANTFEWQLPIDLSGAGPGEEG